jgi:CubicO group peptidase (beta-lactamase class C family)
MKKPITHIAVIMLYEESYFQLDAPVANYTPEFKDMKVYSYKDQYGIHLVEQIQPMTIRNLLTDMSGLGSGGGINRHDHITRTMLRAP